MYGKAGWLIRRLRGDQIDEREIVEREAGFISA
jgi:hypothetical protein